MSERLCGEDWIRSRAKRRWDIALSATLAPLVLPASAIGAAAFFVESGINPLFYQERLGQGNEPMSVMKLRTMPFKHDMADGSMGHADERANRVGRLLRKTTLDEAPQIWHILVGCMSVVGPRPLVVSDVERTMDLLSPKEQEEWVEARSMSKPGWLSDFGNKSRSLEPQADDYLHCRVEEDINYALHASRAVDLRIIKDALAIGTTMVEG